MRTITLKSKKTFELLDSFNSIEVQVKLIELEIADFSESLEQITINLRSAITKDHKDFIKDMSEAEKEEFLTSSVSCSAFFIKAKNELIKKILDTERKPLNELFSLVFKNCNDVDFYDFKKFHVSELLELFTFFLEIILIPYAELINTLKATSAKTKLK